MVHDDAVSLGPLPSRSSRHRAATAENCPKGWVSRPSVNHEGTRAGTSAAPLTTTGPPRIERLRRQAPTYGEFPRPPDHGRLLIAMADPGGTMTVAIHGTYAGGDARLDESLQGTLEANLERFRFAYDEMWLDGMTPKHRTGEIDWPADGIIGLSVGDVAHYRGLTVGGLIPIGDDLIAGALGQIGGGSSALILILGHNTDAPGRCLVRFACTAPDAQAFVNAVQRERLAAERGPLPPVEEVDARSREDDQATILVELRDLAREQVALLRQIAVRLDTTS